MYLRGVGVQLVSALAAASVLVGPAVAQSAVPGDPSDVIYSIDIGKDGSLGKLSTDRIPDRGFYTDPSEQKPKKDLAQPKEPNRLQPDLEQLVASGDSKSIIAVLIGLKEDTVVPRLPDLPYATSRDSAVAKDLSRQQDQIVGQLLKSRQGSQAALIARMQEKAKLDVKEQYWLVNAFLANVELGSVVDMLQFDQVQSIQLQSAGEKPPADANPNNDVLDGRGRIVSDPYFNLPNMTGGFVGLLDTGVRTSHTTFAAGGGDHIDFLRDCVNGGATCNNTGAAGFNTDDDCWNHGTSTASIFTGNANQGNNFRGITADHARQLEGVRLQRPRHRGHGARIPGWAAGLRPRVHRRAAGQRGRKRRRWPRPRTTRSTRAPWSSRPMATSAMPPARSAHRRSRTRSSAWAHTTSRRCVTRSSQGRGPATDGRFKPDIQTPTMTETASNASSTAQHVFSGTSGATPYASGAGALTRNFMRQFGLIEPGHVYARMIEAGQHVWPYDNEEGAGDLKMATCGTAFWGKVSINGTGLDRGHPDRRRPGPHQPRHRTLVARARRREPRRRGRPSDRSVRGRAGEGILGDEHLRARPSQRTAGHRARGRSASRAFRSPAAPSQCSGPAHCTAAKPLIHHHCNPRHQLLSAGGAGMHVQVVPAHGQVRHDAEDGPGDLLRRNRADQSTARRRGRARETRRRDRSVRAQTRCPPG